MGALAVADRAQSRSSISAASTSMVRRRVAGSARSAPSAPRSSGRPSDRLDRALCMLVHGQGSGADSARFVSFALRDPPRLFGPAACCLSVHAIALRSAVLSAPDFLARCWACSARSQTGHASVAPSIRCGTTRGGRQRVRVRCRRLLVARCSPHASSIYRPQARCRSIAAADRSSAGERGRAADDARSSRATTAAAGPARAVREPGAARASRAAAMATRRWRPVLAVSHRCDELHGRTG